MQNFRLDIDGVKSDFKAKAGSEVTENILDLASLLNDVIETAYNIGRSGRELKKEDFFFPVKALS